MLHHLFSRYGSDKATHHGYHRYYEPILQPYRERAFNLLEIGLDSGSSLHAWLEYFPLAHIYVMDIGAGDGTADRVTIVKGDQGKSTDLKGVAQKLGIASVIVDDGSHLPEHQITSFNVLFPTLLESGGWYIIEDIETSYWTNGYLYGNSFTYGTLHNLNIVNVFSRLMHDSVNAEFKSNKSATSHSPIDVAAYSQISQISFGANCIMIRKKTKEEALAYDNRPYRFAHCIK